MIPASVSKKGINFIGGWEGLVLRPYNDIGDNATIGYGHLIHLGPVTNYDINHYHGFNMQQAQMLLQADVRTAVDTIHRLVHVPLTQAQFDALASFIYNVGIGAFAKSTLLKDLNKQWYYLIPGQLILWDHVGGKVSQGLLNRRRAEGELFAHGIY